MLNSSNIVVDSHNDAIVSLIRRGGQSLAGPDAPARRVDAVRDPLGAEALPIDAPASIVAELRDPIGGDAAPIQVNIPNLKAGGVDVAFFAIDVTRALGNHLLFALDGFGWFLAEVSAHSDQIGVATTTEEIHALNSEGRIAAVLAVENSDVLQRSLYVLPALYSIGVRAITLTWSYRADAADGAFENATGGGLTKFGKSLVRAMNDIGMLVDISHISDRGFWDAVDVSSAPLIGTHNCCRALTCHPRNLDDDQIRAIASGGGVIGATLVPSFVDRENPSLDGFLDHVEHFAEVGGIDCVGIGSDFDGGGDVMTDAGEFQRIAEGLSDRGWNDNDLAKVMGLNHMRLFEQVCG